MPDFRHAQRVRFVGGEGIVRSYTSESGSWTYLIEMALGLEPDFGRVGAETMAVLTETDRKYAPDLARDPFYTWLDRYFLLLQLPLGILLYMLGGWSFVVYGVFVRAVLLWHTTWLINSATHLVGDRTFETEDGSRNLWWAALLTFGEEWHNNHHAYPNVAKAGWKWWQVDLKMLASETCCKTLPWKSSDI